MNRVETCMQYKCMGLYENLTKIIFLNSHVHLRNEGGARICGEVVLVNFWCHFEETLISIFSIAVSQNQAVCGLFKYFWLISMQFQFSYSYYSVWCLYVYLCHFVVMPSPLCPLQRWLTAHRIPLNIWHLSPNSVTIKNKYHHLSK